MNKLEFELGRTINPVTQEVKTRRTEDGTQYYVETLRETFIERQNLNRVFSSDFSEWFKEEHFQQLYLSVVGEDQ